MAAIRASSLGQKVAIVEKNHSVGQKLMLSGKGRCNFTNAEPNLDVFISKYGPNGKFLYSAFSKFGPLRTREYFSSIGVKFVEERGKRIFPKEGGSQRVLDSLLMQCRKGGVKIIRATTVQGLKVKNHHIDYIVTNNDEFSADKYILATGGKSYPKTGSTGDGYEFARRIGHTIEPLYPALVPVKTAETWPKLASGCNLRNVRVRVILDDKQITDRFGEMEFTNFGVSGPVIMELSRLIPDWKGALQFSVDLKPSLALEVLVRRIDREIERRAGHGRFAGLVRSLVPEKMVNLILELSDVPHDKPVEYISHKEVIDTAEILKDIRLNVNGLWSFDNAIVTRGGVSLKEVDASTMGSKICDNLYFAGEILDLVGPSGGFNLQICWSTGYVAGSVKE